MLRITQKQCFLGLIKTALVRKSLSRPPFLHTLMSWWVVDGHKKHYKNILTKLIYKNILTKTPDMYSLGQKNCPPSTSHYFTYSHTESRKLYMTIIIELKKSFRQMGLLPAGASSLKSYTPETIPDQKCKILPKTKIMNIIAVLDIFPQLFDFPGNNEPFKWFSVDPGREDFEIAEIEDADIAFQSHMAGSWKCNAEPSPTTSIASNLIVMINDQCLWTLAGLQWPWALIFDDHISSMGHCRGGLEGFSRPTSGAVWW